MIEYIIIAPADGARVAACKTAERCSSATGSCANFRVEERASMTSSTSCFHARASAGRALLSLGSSPRSKAPWVSARLSITLHPLACRVLPSTWPQPRACYRTLPWRCGCNCALPEPRSRRGAVAATARSQPCPVGPSVQHGAAGTAHASRCCGDAPLKKQLNYCKAPVCR